MDHTINILSPLLIKVEVLLILVVVLALSVAWLFWEIFSFVTREKEEATDWDALKNCNHHRLIIPVSILRLALCLLDVLVNILPSIPSPFCAYLVGSSSTSDPDNHGITTEHMNPLCFTIILCLPTTYQQPECVKGIPEPGTLSRLTTVSVCMSILYKYIYQLEKFMLLISFLLHSLGYNECGKEHDRRCVEPYPKNTEPDLWR